MSTCTRLRAPTRRARRARGRLASSGLDLESPLRTVSDRVAAGCARSGREGAAGRGRCWSATSAGPRHAAPASGCPWRPATTPRAGGSATGLDAALQRAARRTGTTFVDMYAASRGHDICSRDPWVNGSGERPAEGAGLPPLRVRHAGRRPRRRRRRPRRRRPAPPRPPRHRPLTRGHYAPPAVTRATPWVTDNHPMR